MMNTCTEISLETKIVTNAVNNQEKNPPSGKGIQNKSPVENG